MKLKPITAFWNKQYSETELGRHFRNLLRAVHLKFKEKSKLENCDYIEENRIFFSDDILVGMRNLGFLDDPLFIRALGPRQADPLLMGRLWRLWVVCWSLSVCWKQQGDILDLGTYNGKAMYTACKYSYLIHGSIPLGRNIILSDLFDAPPNEARKKEHGPNLRDQVAALFQHTFGDTKVIQGSIPSCLHSLPLKSISWCQIDLNSAKYDSETFEYIFELLMPGAHVIFDDYGFLRYKQTQEKLDLFLSPYKGRILELPTGQGLYIHQ